MATFSVKIKWGKQKFEGVELDTSQPLAVFKMKVFSLSSVPPERQQLLLKGKTLTDDTDLTKLEKLKNGATLMLLMMGERCGLAEERDRATKTIVVRIRHSDGCTRVEGVEVTSMTVQGLLEKVCEKLGRSSGNLQLSIQEEASGDASSHSNGNVRTLGKRGGGTERTLSPEQTLEKEGITEEGVILLLGKAKKRRQEETTDEEEKELPEEDVDERQEELAGGLADFFSREDSDGDRTPEPDPSSHPLYAGLESSHADMLPPQRPIDICCDRCGTTWFKRIPGNAYSVLPPTQRSNMFQVHTNANPCVTMASFEGDANRLVCPSKCQAPLKEWVVDSGSGLVELHGCTVAICCGSGLGRIVEAAASPPAAGDQECTIS